MIISASRRTDIPALYAPWFMERIREGYCLVPNPYNRKQVSRVSLAPAEVEIIVFWTRNPRPLLSRLTELDQRGYRYYFQFTLTGYPASLEPHLPPAADLLASFLALSRQVGPQRVLWRYDPILLSDLTDAGYHLRRFRELAEALSGATQRVTISLFDPYPQALRRLRGAGVWARETQRIDAELADLLRGLSATAGEQGMEIVSCAEPRDLSPYGIPPGKCVDDAYIARVFGLQVPAAKDPHQRPACGCVASKDIGMYDTCAHGCLYCYASAGRLPAGAYHDPLGPALLAWPTTG